MLLCYVIIASTLAGSVNGKGCCRFGCRDRDLSQKDDCCRKIRCTSSKLDAHRAAVAAAVVDGPAQAP